jgi:hypothetical protein
VKERQAPLITHELVRREEKIDHGFVRCEEKTDHQLVRHEEEIVQAQNNPMKLGFVKQVLLHWMQKRCAENEK